MDINDAPINARLAYEELEKLGVPVRESHYGSSAYFSINAEEPVAHYYLDYWSNYWGSKQLNKILETYGLYFEWENSAWCNIYDI